MQPIFASFFITALALVSSAAFADDVPPSVEARISAHIAATKTRFTDFYQDLHRSPELSGREVLTAPKIAAGLASAGFDVTTGVGGYGVVGVLRNGAGPTIMVRTDMDGLPVTEETSLPYASQVPGVMHACGHDLHMATFLATAEALSQLRDQWRGTLVFVGQPAEETVTGARAMIADGLFTRFPKPDYAIAFHNFSTLPAGMIGFRAGPAMAAVDSVDVTLRGRDAHGSAPHLGIDPIVLGSEYVLKMNAIVAREVDPTVPALITVGSFHGGTKHNIIPASVKLQMTVRNFDEVVRAFLKERIQQVAEELSSASRAPAPTVEFPEGTGTTVNDPALTSRVMARLRNIVPANRVVDMPLIMGAEDFSEYGRLGQIPTFLFFVSSGDVTLPRPWAGAHTSKFAPDFANAWPVAVNAMTNAVLSLQLAPTPRPLPVGGRSGSPEMMRFSPADIRSMIRLY